jgi:hypothetical protein
MGTMLLLWLIVASPPLALGCHYTTVTITNGTWCCGDGGRGDGGVSFLQKNIKMV